MRQEQQLILDWGVLPNEPCLGRIGSPHSLYTEATFSLQERWSTGAGAVSRGWAGPHLLSLTLSSCPAAPA